MRTTGRRTLAGIAAGALAFTGLAFVATPSAQAAQTVRVVCNPGGTTASPNTDPTTVDPNCTVAAGVGVFVNFIDSALLPIPSATSWLEFSVDGASTFSLVTPSTPGTLVVSADGKKVSGQYQDMTNPTAEVRLSVFSPGTRTVTVRGGASQAEQDLRDLGTLTVTGTGLGNTVAVSQAYEVVNAAGSSASPIAIVHVLDEAGAPLNLLNATVGPITQPSGAGNVTAVTGSGAGNTMYVANDCIASGGAKGTLRSGIDPQATGAGGIVTPACEVTLAAGANANNLGLWVYWTGSTTNVGKYSASFNLTLGSSTYPVTVNYTISNNLAAATGGVKFDKDQYRTGELVTVSTTLADPNGLPVPDGLGSGRGVSLAGTASNAPIYSPVTGLVIPAASAFVDDSLATYGGVATGAFIAPPTPMENFRYTLTLSAQSGFASSIQGNTSSATARIGDPAPVTQSIAIVGSRVEGTSQVIVEGTSEGLVGKTVTPYFRFPGETGFTAGTGTRTVDAEGNFNWQRKTGKKIAVQFRGEGVVSNTVIIDAK